MHAPGQKSQHAHGICGINRLAQNGIIHNHNRVRSQHPILRPSSPHRERLFPRQPLRTLTRRLACPGSLINIGWLNSKRNPRVAQKLLASWRCGGENDHGILILLDSVPSASAILSSLGTEYWVLNTICCPPRRAPTQSACPSRTDRKSTRLNSSHLGISYAVFCL